jgi:sialic acid synthase SpsE
LKTYIHENIKEDDKRVERFTSTELSENNWKNLINLSRKNFKVICTPFSEKSVDWVCKKKFDYLKIASCSFDDWPLLEKIKNKKIKIICSLGGGTINDISKTISFLSNKNIKFLYCVGIYPTNTDDINLSYFLKLRDIFGECITGFSSHEKPNEYLSGALAYGMGVRIFEKHINIKSNKYKINEYSTTPSDFKIWLENLNDSIVLNGSVDNREKNLKLEKKYIGNFKRGVFIKKNCFINKGDKINLPNVEFKFPAQKNQLLANDFSKFINIKAKKNISPQQPVMKNVGEVINPRIKIEKIRVNRY